MGSVPRSLFVARRLASRGAFEWALIGCAFVGAFAFLSHGLLGDDDVRFQDIKALLNHGHLTASRYSLVGPLVSAPLLLLGRVVRSPEWWAARFNVVVVLAASLAAMRLCRGRVDARLLRRTLLILLLSSYLLGRLRDYNAEVLSAALVTLGIVALELGRGRTRAWLVIVVGVVNTPAALGGLALLTGRQALRDRRLRSFWPLAAAALLVMGESWLRRGGPFVTGYAGDHGYRTVMPYSGHPGFSYPLLFGLFSILFSFGRGLIFFMPALVLILVPRDRLQAPACVFSLLVFLSGLVLVYSKWWAWYGGVGFGPRFFLIGAVPASILIARRTMRTAESLSSAAVTLVILTLSTWVAIVGVIASTSSLQTCVANAYADESLCWYTPEFSPLGNPLVHFPLVSKRSFLLVGLCLLAYAYLARPFLVRLARGSWELRPRALLSWRF